MASVEVCPEAVALAQDHGAQEAAASEVVASDLRVSDLVASEEALEAAAASAPASAWVVACLIRQAWAALACPDLSVVAAPEISQ